MKVLFVDPPFHRFMGFYRFLYPVGAEAVEFIEERNVRKEKEMNMFDWRRKLESKPKDLTRGVV